MSENPKIFTYRTVRGGKAKAKGKCRGAPLQYEGEEKGDILIQYLWTHGMDSIHYMHVVNNDVVSYQSKIPQKCLETAE